MWQKSSLLKAVQTFSLYKLKIGRKIKKSPVQAFMRFNIWCNNAWCKGKSAAQVLKRFKQNFRNQQERRGWSNSSENLCQQLLRQKSALKAFQSSQIHKIRSAGVRKIEARNYADNCCSLNAAAVLCCTATSGLNAAAVLYKRLERSYATNRRLGKQRAL